MRSVLASLIAHLVFGCASIDPMGEPHAPDPASVDVTDEGPSSGYQDFWFGTYKRGRGNVVADFDGDGDPDVFSANPANESFLIRNTTKRGGPLRFEPWQVLSADEYFYGGVAVDFDNDGDPDLFVSAGANDGAVPDRFYQNTGDHREPLVDISDLLPLVPRNPNGSEQPNGTMGMNAFDADNDGLLDVFASNFASMTALARSTEADVVGLNQLYMNAGGLRFEDRAISMGIRVKAGTRHSSVLDVDLDGDQDIYENNFLGPSILWRNLLAESGRTRFVDATAELSLGAAGLQGSDRDQSMCSLAADLDNDGWEDLVVLNRGREDTGSGVVVGHQVFMNVQGTGFVEVGEHTRLSDTWEIGPGAAQSTGPMGTGWGVMGCQIGDLNLDGTPDIFVGTGGGSSGEVDRLFVSSTLRVITIDGVGPVTVPVYDNWSDKLDFPAVPVTGATEVAYPYRTHGSSMADFDGDGTLELAVHNGGPAIFDNEEPNRLWKFDLPDPRFLRVRVYGDGGGVARDAIGTHVRITVERDADGASWALHQTRRAGSGFGAQNEAELLFGLADADRVTAIDITWPDGATLSVDPPEGPQNWITVTPDRGIIDQRQ